MDKALEDYRMKAAEVTRGTSAEPVYNLVLRICRERGLRGKVLDYGSGIGTLPGILHTAFPEAEMWAALDSARIGEHVRGLPHGLDTVVGARGHRFSGGEKQRLADITRPDVPFLAAAATFGNPQLRTVFDWFATQLAVLNPWRRPDLFGETARRAADNPDLRSKLRAIVARSEQPDRR